jgi:hypothetical protein
VSTQNSSSRWPERLGGISVAWAVINIAVASCRGLGAYIGDLNGSEITLADFALPACSGVWAVVLLGAGVLTMRRRDSGRVLHVAYAVGLLILLVPELWVGADRILRHDYFARYEPPGRTFNKPAEWLVLGTVALVQCAWPVFCLVWFAPKKHSPDINAPEAPVA